MDALKLREERAKKWAGAKAFLDSHRQTNGTLSAEDDAAYAKMEQEIMDLGREIERMDRMEAIDKELAKATSTPIVDKPEKKMAEKKTGTASDEYKKDFFNHMRGRETVYNVLATTPGSNGGYLCPDEFEKQIVDTLKEENVMRKLCKVITTHNDRKIPVAASHSVAHWTAENDAYTESNPTFGQKEIEAYKLTDLIKVSMELLEDSAFELENYFANEFAYAFGAAEEEAFCVGTGATDHQPTGLFTANGASVGVTAAATNAITADELINLIYSLDQPYRKNAVFLMNDETVSAIRKLKDGNGVYIWQPSLVAGEPDKLLGYDLYTSPYVPTMASDALVIGFGDFNNYWIADRSGRTIQKLTELYSTNGQVGFVATERVDGKMIVPDGVKLLKMKH